MGRKRGGGGGGGEGAGAGETKEPENLEALHNLGPSVDACGAGIAEPPRAPKPSAESLK